MIIKCENLLSLVIICSLGLLCVFAGIKFWVYFLYRKSFV